MTQDEQTGLVVGEDGAARCFWHGNLPDYMHYHDHEWGRPVADDKRLFEKLCLEGFQSGLSWLTILRKRENFREAFSASISRSWSTTRNGMSRCTQECRHHPPSRQDRLGLQHARRAIELPRNTGRSPAIFGRRNPRPRTGQPGSTSQRCARCPRPRSRRASPRI